MKSLQALMAAATLACVQPAQAATTDPEIIIYRASGVIDTGSAASTGTATVIHCTNVSTATENVRFVVRNFNSVIATNQMSPVPSFQTLTVSTHFTNLYDGAIL